MVKPPSNAGQFSPGSMMAPLLRRGICSIPRAAKRRIRRLYPETRAYP